VTGVAARRLQSLGRDPVVVSFSAVGAAHRRRLIVGATVAVVALILTVGAPGTVVGVGAAAGAALVTRRSRRARHLRETHAGVVDICRAMAAELRAGRPVPEAFGAAARAGPPPLVARLQPAIAVGRRGDSAELADVVSVVAASPGCTGLSRVVACWRVAATSGAALAPAVDRVADALQDDIELRRDVTSTLAGPRATAHLLAGLPAVGLLLGTAIGADPVGFLLGSGPGIGCLLAAVALDSAGLAWARRISRRVARFG
jgi:tight adherence protein B